MLVSRRKFLLHSSLAALSPLVAQESIESFALPPKSVFDPAMPRYPNLWFLIDLSLAGSYEQVVKKITETRGGCAWVESVEGHGATFHVLWPRRPLEGNS